jgi:indolepyruvate ferredoxin oxidoreductase alpha subunit
VQAFRDTLREADRYCRGQDGGVAVIIAWSPCVLLPHEAATRQARPVRVTEDCTGCEVCVTAFDCPALVWDEEEGKARIHETACTGCEVCLGVCPMGAILADRGGPV